MGDKAKRAGYEVDGRFLDRVLGYLRQQARDNKTEDYYYYDHDDIHPDYHDDYHPGFGAHDGGGKYHG